MLSLSNKTAYDESFCLFGEFPTGISRSPGQNGHMLYLP